MKTFADDKLNDAKVRIPLFDRVENTVGKGENADYQHFLHFPVFSNVFYFGMINIQDCVVKNKRPQSKYM